MEEDLERALADVDVDLLVSQSIRHAGQGSTGTPPSLNGMSLPPSASRSYGQGSPGMQSSSAGNASTVAQLWARIQTLERENEQLSSALSSAAGDGENEQASNSLGSPTPGGARVSSLGVDSLYDFLFADSKDKSDGLVKPEAKSGSGLVLDLQADSAAHTEKPVLSSHAIRRVLSRTVAGHVVAIDALRGHRVRCLEARVSTFASQHAVVRTRVAHDCPLTFACRSQPLLHGSREFSCQCFVAIEQRRSLSADIFAVLAQVPVLLSSFQWRPSALSGTATEMWSSLSALWVRAQREIAVNWRKIALQQLRSGGGSDYVSKFGGYDVLLLLKDLKQPTLLDIAKAMNAPSRLDDDKVPLFVRFWCSLCLTVGALCSVTQDMRPSSPSFRTCFASLRHQLEEMRKILCFLILRLQETGGSGVVQLRCERKCGACVRCTYQACVGVLSTFQDNARHDSKSTDGIAKMEDVSTQTATSEEGIPVSDQAVSTFHRERVACSHSLLSCALLCRRFVQLCPGNSSSMGVSQFDSVLKGFIGGGNAGLCSTWYFSKADLKRASVKCTQDDVETHRKAHTSEDKQAPNFAGDYLDDDYSETEDESGHDYGLLSEADGEAGYDAMCFVSACDAFGQLIAYRLADVYPRLFAASDTQESAGETSMEVEDRKSVKSVQAQKSERSSVTPSVLTSFEDLFRFSVRALGEVASQLPETRTDDGWMNARLSAMTTYLLELRSFWTLLPQWWARCQHLVWESGQPVAATLLCQLYDKCLCYLEARIGRGSESDVRIAADVLHVLAGLLGDCVHVSNGQDCDVCAQKMTDSRLRILEKSFVIESMDDFHVLEWSQRILQGWAKKGLSGRYAHRVSQDLERLVTLAEREMSAPSTL